MTAYRSSAWITIRQEVRSGNRDRARQLLFEIVQENPEDERAWLWLGGLSTSAVESINYIRRAEALRPNDPSVKKALLWAEQKLRTAQKSPEIAVSRPTDFVRTESSIPGTRRLPRSSEAQWRHKLKRLVSIGSVILVLCGLLIIAGLAWNGWRNYRTSPVSVAEAHASENGLDLYADALSSATREPGVSVRQAQPLVSHYDPPATATMNPLSPKNVVAGSGSGRAAWTATPLPTNTPTPTATPLPTFVSDPSTTSGLSRPLGLAPNERWIDVSLDNQMLVAYEGNTPVFESLVSTGRSKYPTVTGQFRIWLRLPKQDMNGFRLGYDYDLKGVPYVQYFYEDYALHGTYWHNNFGAPMSHGCVNLPTPAAEWLFEWATQGTLVNIHR